MGQCKLRSLNLGHQHQGDEKYDNGDDDDDDEDDGDDDGDDDKLNLIAGFVGVSDVEEENSVNVYRNIV